MRFNAKELACIAQEKSEYFDFESILYVREKTEGLLFKKGKAFVERFFRLKGNILFHFKGREKSSDVGGVYILERCCVQLEEDEFDEFHFYCFSIVFEGEQSQNLLYLGSPEECIRDRWIELVHVSSFECMKFQLDSLRDRIQSKTGNDPILQLQENYQAANNASNMQEFSEGTYLEMGILCKGLPADTQNRPYDTFIALHYFVPSSKEQWAYHGRTEVIEKSCNPSYVSVINFKHFDVVNLKTKLRLSLRAMKEIMTNTAVTIGTAEFTLMEILSSPSMSSSFTLRSSKYDEIGTAVITLWLNSNSSNKQVSKIEPSEIDLLFSKSKLLEDTAISSRSSSHLQATAPCRLGIDTLFLVGRNIRTFRFPVTGPISTPGLLVNEHLSEFKHTFLLPYHFLKMLIQDEKSKVLSYRNLGKLVEKYDGLRNRVIDFHISTLVYYEQQLKFFYNNKDLSFKPSVKKTHKEVEFAATNLHNNSMYVSSNIHEDYFRYDITTVGAFTAGAQKYKHGGVRKLANQLNQSLTKGEKYSSRMQQCKELLTLLDDRKQEIFSKCDTLCSRAVNGKVEPVRDSFKLLESRVNRLLKKSEDDIIIVGVIQLHSTRFISTPEGSTPSTPTPYKGGDPQDDQGGFNNGGQEKSALSENWIWNGSDYVQGETEEPYDMVRLNVEAALVNLRGRLQELFQQSEDKAVSWLEKISGQVIILRKSVEMLVKRCKRGLNFLIMQDVANNLPLYHSLKCRRDVVFCQALTAAVSGFLSKLSCLVSSLSASKCQPTSPSSSRSSTPRHQHRRQNNRQHSVSSSSSSSSLSSLSNHTPFPRSLCVYKRIGVLMQFESLLSCYGDEMSMLEDHTEGVADLCKVKFKIESKILDQSNGSDHSSEKAVNRNCGSSSVVSASDVNILATSSCKDSAAATSIEDACSLSDVFSSAVAVAGETDAICKTTEASFGDLSTVDLSLLTQHSKKVKNSRRVKNEEIEYRIVGSRDRCEVVISLPKDVFEDIKDLWQHKGEVEDGSCKESFEVNLVPVLFTIGINEQATIAEKFFNVELQDEINQENFQKLNNYYKDFCSLPDELKGTDIKTLNSAMQILHQNIFILKKNKNVDILHLAADICRHVDGVRFTSCKSAKDRTAMSATLEEVTLLKREHDLSADLFNHALDAFRSEGVRRDNTYKNTGVRKYAFNSIQLLSVPKLYRPPKGTFGNLEA